MASSLGLRIRMNVASETQWAHVRIRPSPMTAPEPSACRRSVRQGWRTSISALDTSSFTTALSGSFLGASSAPSASATDSGWNSASAAAPSGSAAAENSAAHAAARKRIVFIVFMVVLPCSGSGAQRRGVRPFSAVCQIRVAAAGTDFGSHGSVLWIHTSAASGGLGSAKTSGNSHKTVQKAVQFLVRTHRV